MAQTIVGINSPQTVKKWSNVLMAETFSKGFFTSKMMSKGNEGNTPFQRIDELESDSGDEVKFDLSLQLRTRPVMGDKPLAGQLADLRFAQDKVSIDQMRCGVNGGGRMTRKRTVHDLRMIAKSQQADWWARTWDELAFSYLSGSRGVNAGFNLALQNEDALAVNPLTAPDAQHLVYGGAATSKASLVASDAMSFGTLNKARTRANAMVTGSGVPPIRPLNIDGEEAYVAVLSPYQVHAIRANTSPGEFLDVNKAVAAANGNKSPIFKDSIGTYRGIVIHEKNRIIQFNDYGVGSNVAAARALLLGRQAGVIAFGNSARTGDQLFDWHEETSDHGNQLEISSSAIFGMKKTTYTVDGVARDFGVISIDTANIDPT